MRASERRRLAFRTAALLFGVFAVAQSSFTQAVRAPQPVAAAKPLTFEWIFGPEGRSVASVPGQAWLDNGTALVLDNRGPAGQRTIEVLDPQTGSRRPALDMAKAVMSLKALAPDAGVIDTLPPPGAFDPKGRYAAYLFGGRVFLLDMPAAQFSRVTAATAEEKCVAFSPDGRKLSFVRANDLFVYDIGARSETRLTRDGSETLLNGTLTWVYWEEIFGRRDIGYWWAPDSSAIAFLQTDESPVEVSSFVDFQPQMPRVIRQRYPKAGLPNPRVRVGIAEVGRDQATWIRIEDRPFANVARVKWLPDSRRVSVETMTRDHTELNLYFADRSTGGSSRILSETDPAWVNINDDLYFLKDGQFLWGSERTGFLHLYRYAMDGRLVNPVTSGEWAMASSGGGVFWLRQAVTGIDEQGGWVYFTSNQGASIERQLYRVRLDGNGLARITKESGTHAISMSPDARYYLDRFSTIRTLSSLSLHSADGATRAVIAAPRPELLAPFGVQYPQLLTIPAADGFPLPAQILRPAGFRPERKYPVILYIYGGPSAPTVANAWQQSVLFDQLLLREGFIVVSVDNRSATAINKRLENTILKRSGEPETADLVAAVKWLKSQPWVDPSRVGVWGWSGGGTMTLNLLTRSTEFKAGIAVAPVTDWRYYDTFWAETFMKRPQDNPDGYEATSLVKRARHLHGRLLIVWGTYDDNVHPQNEQAFINALIEAGVPFETMVYPMRKHDIGDRAATMHLYRAMLEFWKRSL